MRIYISLFSLNSIQVMKSRYESIPPSQRRRIRSLLTFLYTGLYNVTYPKTGKQRGRSGSTSSTTGEQGKSTAGSSAAADSQNEYNKAMQLLNNIDKRMSGTTGVSTAGAGGLTVINFGGPSNQTSPNSTGTL